MTKVVVDCIRGTFVFGVGVLLSLALVSVAEGYLVEDPVLQERGNKGFALGELDWRLQFRELLLV